LQNPTRVGCNIQSFFWKGRWPLTPKCPRPFLCQKPLKTASSVAFIQKKRFFLESNRRILYFTCLKSCGKNFMKFDYTNWKIIAFKVGNICFLNASLQFQITLIAICGIFCTIYIELKKDYVEELSWKSRKKISKKNVWFLFFKKLLSRSRSKIERKTKSLVALRWNWNIIITMVRLF